MQNLPKLRETFSLVPFRIFMYFKDAEIAIGTAFFYLYKGKPYLVTNWHNVTGRGPVTLRCKSSQAAIPDRLLVELPRFAEHSSGVKCIQWRSYGIPLYEDEGDTPSRPVWYEHPQYKHNVDAVAIPIESIGPTEDIGENAALAANDPWFGFPEPEVELRPGLDVFVLGFPKGMSGAGSLPIWKRGNIASEPDFDIDGLPKILIDTATREGMSGSPVYARQIGYWARKDVAPSEGECVLGEGRRFLGVYSGRVGDDLFQAQMGIVWKPSAIEEIIQGEMIGTSSFDLVPVLPSPSA